MPFVDRPGARIHYTATGSGPPVLLLQGVGVAGQGWRPQVEALSPHYRVISLDNRGIGRSTMTGTRLTIEEMAADALAAADAEGAARFHLMGHSMGGVIAQEVALAAASRVRSLAFLCSFHKGSQATAMTAGLLWTAIRARAGTRRMRRRAFVELVMTREYLAGVDRDELCVRLQDLFGRDLADQPPILMRQLRAMGRYDASSRLAQLSTIPTLVVSAAEDRIARPAFGRALAGAIPGARYVELTGAGHAVTIARAAEVNALLLEHLTSAAAP